MNLHAKPNRPFDAAIFDLDGTLLDSLEDIGNAANEVLVSLGKSPHPIADFRFLVGDGVGVLFQRALPECTTNAELHRECMHRFEQTYASQWHNRSKPYDGIPDLLNSLCAQGLKLGVLSNKPDAFTQQCVQHFFPTARFACVMGHSTNFPRKPDPASARWMAAQFGVANDRIAYVGDTNTDMKTAVGAGLFAIGVSWGFRPESELVANGACVVCHDVASLEATLIQS
jgi:phosphoglycolate phosphatase